MKQNRQKCVLYVTATCNLQCKYCYIDKSPVLVKIDKMLEESYKGDYYFNFMKEMFEPQQLTTIEFWGGEPTYGLGRALPTVLKAISYYQRLDHFFFSTNLTTPSCVNDIISFCQTIAEQYPERSFTFGLQLSIDGPTEINDFNRGERVTERFTNNFSKLLFAVKEVTKRCPNLNFEAHFKPTLDGYAIGLLQTKEAIIRYYQFLESYKITADSYLGDCPQWSFHPAIPNTATPSPHTTAEGKQFATLCRLINEIEAENATMHHFEFYTSIMPFLRGAAFEDKSLQYGCGTCGSGDVILGLLPNNMISGCHNGFVELLAEYKHHAPEATDYQIDTTLFKNNDTNHLIFTKEEYAVYERQVQCYCTQSKFQIVEFSALIRQMAAAGQIEKKYMDPQEAAAGAHFIQFVVSNCMRDNLGVAGSKFLFPTSFIRLFLNGAREEIQKNAIAHNL